MLTVHADIFSKGRSFEYLQKITTSFAPRANDATERPIPKAQDLTRITFFLSNPNAFPDVSISGLPIGGRRIVILSGSLLNWAGVKFRFDGFRFWPQMGFDGIVGKTKKRPQAPDSLSRYGDILLKETSFRPVCDLNDDLFWTGAEVLLARHSVAS